MYNPTMIDIVGGFSVWEARMLLPGVSPHICAKGNFSVKKLKKDSRVQL